MADGMVVFDFRQHQSTRVLLSLSSRSSLARIWPVLPNVSHVKLAEDRSILNLNFRYFCIQSHLSVKQRVKLLWLVIIRLKHTLSSTEIFCKCFSSIFTHGLKLILSLISFSDYIIT